MDFFELVEKFKKSGLSPTEAVDQANKKIQMEEERAERAANREAAREKEEAQRLQEQALEQKRLEDAAAQRQHEKDREEAQRLQEQALEEKRLVDAATQRLQEQALEEKRLADAAAQRLQEQALEEKRLADAAAQRLQEQALEDKKLAEAAAQRQHQLQMLKEQQAEAETQRKFQEAQRIKEEEAAGAAREHATKRMEHDKKLQEFKETAELAKAEARKTVEQAKLDLKKEMPRHKKYQGLIKTYTKEDEMSSWLRNLESIFNDEDIPREDWAFILRKCLSGEPLKVIETVPVDDLNNYRKLKELLEQHYKLTEMGQREKFKLLTPKASQTFLDYVSEIKLTLDNWVKAANIHNNQGIFDLFVKDKILSSVPHKLSTFLIEQGVEDFDKVIKKGTAYCDANKDVFSSSLTAELNIGAAATFHNKPRYNTHKSKKVGFKPLKKKAPWRGNFTDCKYCHRSHGDQEMCEDNPGYKTFLANHMKNINKRNALFKPRHKCWCCHAIGHFCTSCPCRQAKQLANFICEEDSEQSDDSYQTTDSETMHDDPSPTASACEILGIEQIQNCVKCAKFHETAKLSCGHKVPFTMFDANALQGMNGKLRVVPGFVNNAQVTVLRDTGSTLIGVHKTLVRPKDYTGEHVICRTFGGEQQRYPIAWIKVNTPFISGRVKSAVLPSPCAELIIGNVPKVIDPDNDTIEQWVVDNKCSVTNALTRQQTAKLREEKDQPQMPIQPLVSQSSNTHQTEIDNIQQAQTKTQSETDIPSTDTNMLPNQQEQDNTLVKCWELVNKPDRHTKHSTIKFVVLNKVLYRIHQKGAHMTKQIVLPYAHRQKVFELAHSSAFGGHMCTQKTIDRIQLHYYWPGLSADIKQQCKDCHQCQSTRPPGKFPKALLQTTDIPFRPFEKVAIDIIGPMPVPSARGNLYILTMVDLCTRWPEAIPLRTITSEAVAEALLLIFSRVGFPNTILSDNGPQFVSQATRLVLSKLGIKQVFSTPYHPQTNGTCERFNGTLKAMLGKVVFENPTIWDVMLPAVMFAYREVPQETTKFSPFELVYGANPRGPLCIYRELLLNADVTAENRSAYDLVTSVRERVMKGCEIANKSTELSHAIHRKYKNKNKKHVTFEKGDLVMLLLPRKSQKLLVEWQGPYSIVDKISDVDYSINVNGRLRLFHVNMIAKYHTQKVIQSADTNTVILLHDTSYDSQPKTNRRHETMYEANTLVTDDGDQEGILDIVEPVTRSQTTYKDVKLGPILTTDQKRQVDKLLRQYKDIFSDVPGQSKAIRHHIRVTTDVPIKVRPYVIPEHYREKVELEIKELEKLKVIQRSNSNYSSSMVVIKKKDDTLRICIDYRKLNQITITDAEPIPSADELISKMANSELFSKLDMTKGYYQIPLTQESKHLTAFATSLGLYEFNFMPFGLVNAPATFVRMTRALLRGLPNVVTYIDDMCIHTENFTDHMDTLEKVFQRVKENGLTVKPVKAEIGFSEIAFLGHCIKKGTVATEDTIVSKILKINPPKTKKHVQALLGLINYYSKFIPCFANKTAVLSSLLKKENKKILWTEECQIILDDIKKLFSAAPILKLPNYRETFVIQTDASNIAISGCLGQYYDSVLHPCMYVSRKLTNAEKNYATVELEALAVVFTITKFKRFLLGKPFLIQSDNQPLRVITSGIPKNTRIARWALVLQDFQFTVSHIEGRKNCLADLLSRL